MMNREQLNEIKLEIETIERISAKLEVALENTQPLIDVHDKVGMPISDDTQCVVAGWYEVCATFNRMQCRIHDLVRVMETLTR